MMEKIKLDIYACNKGSLLIIPFSRLNISDDTLFFEIVDDKKRKVLFDIIEIDKLRNLVLILENKDVEYIEIMYDGNKNKFTKLKKRIELIDADSLVIKNNNVEINFEKEFFSIDSFKIGSKEFSSLQLVTSGGNAAFQKGNFRNAKYDVICDSPLLKVIKLVGEMPVFGEKNKSDCYLPVEMKYLFWSYDNENIFSKVEMKLLFEKAVDKDGNKLSFVKSLMWFRYGGIGDLKYNILFENDMDNSKIVTLKKPYNCCLSEKEYSFCMVPYLALPGDGNHIEIGDDFFGAALHSLSSEKKPYWCNVYKEEDVSESQGYFPARSLNTYWNIGFYFGNEDALEVSKVFTYPCKIMKMIHYDDNAGNPFVTHWKDNCKLALNVITDDGKANDYYWRKDGTIPMEAEVALPTRKKFGLSYSKYCFLSGKLFTFGKSPLLSNAFCTLLTTFKIAGDYKKRFAESGFRLIPHTNSHPVFRKLDSDEVFSEVKVCLKEFKEKYDIKDSLSFIPSYQSSYGLATPKGTRQKLIFDACNDIEWIREWPIPNSPVDYFLPSKLFWGISAGGDFDNKDVADNIKSEFNELYYNGADYMQVSGHVPEKIAKKGPDFLRELFGYAKGFSDVWFTSADDILRYYKNRGSVVFEKIKDVDNEVVFEIKREIKDKFLTEITVSQFVKDLKTVYESVDGSEWNEVKFKKMDDKGEILYNVKKESRFLKVVTGSL